MKYSKKDLKIAKEILQVSLSKEGINETKLFAWVRQVKKEYPKGAIKILLALADAVSNFYKSNTLVVESAENLGAGYLEKIKKNFEARFGKKLNFTFSKNRSLLAGVKIQLSDNIWDYSVSQTLESLKKVNYD